jgi:DNA replication protein DnaC
MPSQFTDKPPYCWREVRVFISSTFRDFHAERDYLVKNVFPEIREWCCQWKLHFVDIDLRWGVTEEQARSGKVIDICLEEVDGSRPFFICMLGNRYGWVPEKKDIPEKTVTHFDKLLSPGKEKYSITHMEIHHAVFESLTSKHVIEQVPHSFFYFRDEKAIPAPETISVLTEKQRQELKKAFFEEKQESIDRLNKLKADLVEHFKNIGQEKQNPNEVAERIYTYSPGFDPALSNPEDDKLKGRLTPSSLKEFGERVKDDLIKKAIEIQFKDRIKALSRKQEQKPLEAELDFHEAFVENRTRLFIGRTELLHKLKSYVESDSKKILAVYGKPGSGKSALLAKFYRDYKYDKDKNQINPELLFIPHFIGASAGSAALYNLLRRCCEEIFNTSLKQEMEQKLAQIKEGGEEGHKQREAIQREYEIPVDINKLSEAFESFLHKTKQKTIILIDGLNQLDESHDAHDLSWLPSALPDSGNVKIIASTLAGKAAEALQKKTDLELEVTALTKNEQREIIQGLPTIFAKTIDPQMVDILIQREETANPLFLKVAMDELRVFGSFEKLGEKIAALPSNVIDLFISVIERLGSENDPKLIEKLFCLLECSRYGLTQNELAELLEEDKDKIHLVILRQIRDYLFNREEVIDFFHQSLSQAVRKKYFEEATVVE